MACGQFSALLNIVGQREFRFNSILSWESSSVSPALSAVPEYKGDDLGAMEVAHNYGRWIVKLLASVLHGRIAEIGAGTGTMSEHLLSTGVELHSFEPASTMYSKMAQRQVPPNSIWVRSNSGLPRDSSEHFDGIVYLNVLEHIEDDRSEINRAVSMLRPGGRLGIVVPALPLLMSEFDRSIGHHRRYLKESLIEACSVDGFSIELVRYFDFLGVPPWFVVMRLLRGSLNRRTVSLYDRAIIPWLSRVERYVIPPIGKNLLLIGRRTA